jgi:hypothetical protein
MGHRSWIAAALAVSMMGTPAPAQGVRAPDDAPQIYVIVLDRTVDGEPFAGVADALTEFRHPVATVDLGAGGLGAAFAELARLRPDYVAFVVPPDRIEDNLVGEIFERATGLDDDPELDFAYGFITGATPQDALAMIRQTRRAEEMRGPAGAAPKFAAIGHTFREADLGMFAIQQAVWMRRYGFEAAAINPIDGSAEWAASAPEQIRRLDGASLVFIAGHGAGDNLCGIDADLFVGFRLDGAVVVNGACHSISTTLRHDISPQTMGIVETRIPVERSVCLRLIHAGAVAQLGSTASSSWMNVGPAIDEFFHEKGTIGAALRDRLNAHIRAEGIKAPKVVPFVVGEPSPQFLDDERNHGYLQSIARVALIGDPAFRPYHEPREHTPYPQIPDRPHPMGEAPAAAGRDLSGLTVAQLIDELQVEPVADFAALNEIIGRGVDAVPALIAALKTTHAWQIPKALGGIADDAAIEPLIAALAANRESPFKDVVAESLELITGLNHGDDPAAWSEWRRTRDE